MGCGASAESHSDNNSEYDGDSDNGRNHRRRDRAVSYAPTHMHDDDEIDGDLEMVYEDTRSQGEVTSESPNFLALKRTAAVAKARLRHGINDDPNQFSSNHSGKLSVATQYHVENFLDDHILETIGIQLESGHAGAEANSNFNGSTVSLGASAYGASSTASPGLLSPKLEPESHRSFSRASHASNGSNKTTVSVENANTSTNETHGETQSQSILSADDRVKLKLSSHFYLPNVNWSHTIDMATLEAAMASGNVDSVADAPLGALLLDDTGKALQTFDIPDEMGSMASGSLSPQSKFLELPAASFGTSSQTRESPTTVPSLGGSATDYPPVQVLPLPDDDGVPMAIQPEGPSEAPRIREPTEYSEPGGQEPRKHLMGVNNDIYLASMDTAVKQHRQSLGWAEGASLLIGWVLGGVPHRLEIQQRVDKIVKRHSDAELSVSGDRERRERSKDLSRSGEASLGRVNDR